jgi:hypothetical protein
MASDAIQHELTTVKSLLMRRYPFGLYSNEEILKSLFNRSVTCTNTGMEMEIQMHDHQSPTATNPLRNERWRDWSIQRNSFGEEPC